MLKENWPIIAFILFLLALAVGERSLLLIASLFATIMIVAFLWNRWALHLMTYTRQFDEERVFVGETARLALELANPKPLPLSWVQVDDRFPEKMPPAKRKLLVSGIPEVGLLSNLAALSGYEKARWSYNIPCQQRGFYFFGPVIVRSGDMFGLFEREMVIEERTRLIVYPTVQPLERLGLPAKNPFGGRRTRLPVFEDPTRVIGVREYAPNDPMRRVHWKATARTQALQVRIWEPTQEPQLIVFLNVATMEKHWLGINEALLERTISVAASICQHAFNDKQSVGLIANASVPHSDQPVKVTSGRSLHQMRHILEALAAVTSYPNNTLSRLLRIESPKLEWGATLVVVTAVVSEALLAHMLRLRRAGRQLALVSLDRTFNEEQAILIETQGIVVHRLAHHIEDKQTDDPHNRFKPPSN